MPKISELPIGATPNDADFFPIVQSGVTNQLTVVDLKSYANTGLTSSSLSDFVEAVQDVVGAFTVAGTGISVNYSDGGNTLTIAVSGLTSGSLSDFAEAVDDRVDALVVAGANITKTYDDGLNTLTLAVSGLDSADISDFSEAVDDRVSNLLVAGTGISLSYNDGANTLTVSGATPSNVVEVSASTPSTPIEGDLWFNTSSGILYLYVDTDWVTVSGSGSGGGGASVTISDTAPVGPSAGDLWFDSDVGTTYLYYDSSWVEVGAGSAVPPAVEVSAATPSSPDDGELWFDSDTGVLSLWYDADSVWIEVGSGGVVDPDTYYGLAQTVETIAGTTYSALVGDVGKLKNTTNGSAVTITLDTPTSLGVEVGSRIDFCQGGAGQAEFVAGSGATVNATPGLKTRDQYSGATAIAMSTTEWWLIGDLAV